MGEGGGKCVSETFLFILLIHKINAQFLYLTFNDIKKFIFSKTTKTNDVISCDQRHTTDINEI